MSKDTDSPDPRPPVWVGHLVLAVPDVSKSKDFFLKLGMRDVEPEAEVGVLELRGGTHLILLKAEAPVALTAAAPFDLMVDDIDASRRLAAEQGLAPSEIEDRDFHRSFKLREPGGHEITVNSSLVSGLPV